MWKKWGSLGFGSCILNDISRLTYVIFFPVLVEKELRMWVLGFASR